MCRSNISTDGAKPSTSTASTITVSKFNLRFVFGALGQLTLSGLESSITKTSILKYDQSEWIRLETNTITVKRPQTPQTSVWLLTEVAALSVNWWPQRRRWHVAEISHGESTWISQLHRPLRGTKALQTGAVNKAATLLILHSSAVSTLPFCHSFEVGTWKENSFQHRVY